MFQKVFITELSQLAKEEALVNDLTKEIIQRYSESHRHYHTLHHLDFMTEELLAVKKQILDWQVLVFSIAFHDAIYQPSKSNNEERSADLAYSRLSRLRFEEARKQKCVSQILATKKHQQAADSDTNYLIDADLAILGTDQKTFANYSKQIRKEYNRYPDFIYRSGRKEVLERFLQMPRIFKTPHFGIKYEVQARINLSSELSDLQ